MEDDHTYDSHNVFSFAQDVTNMTNENVDENVLVSNTENALLIDLVRGSSFV